MREPIVLCALFVILLACEKNDLNPSSKFKYVQRVPVTDTIFEVEADAETEPVDASSGSDAADDPAVWIHPHDVARSIIYGSNKKGGIVAYDLSGSKIAYSAFGAINNIDIAYNLRLRNETIDVCGGTNRTTNAIDLYKIEPESGVLENILDSIVVSGVNEVYGFCFYHSFLTGINYAILCGKNGVVEHYEILEGNEKLGLKLVSSFDIGNQPEGLVADHKHGYLYVGEEENCIWRIDAEPGSHQPERIDLSSEADNENITYDIEGLTIYYTSSENGYLIASSQGNSSFAIYNRYYGNEYIGSFRLVEGMIDGTSETDGIDVINLQLGDGYPGGFFIAQDDKNRTNEALFPQNFKMIQWEKIANIFDPPLYVDQKFNIRSLFD